MLLIYFVKHRCLLLIFTYIYIVAPLVHTPSMLSPFRGGGVEYLNDPDSYAG